MLCLGSGTLAREFFLVPTPNEFRVYAGVALLMGPTFIASLWQAWIAARQPAPEVSQTPTPTVERSSSPPSS